MVRERSKLSIPKILKWADQHHARTGRWPTSRDEWVNGVTGERWSAIHEALRRGLRGLPGGSSLHQLLVTKRHALDPRMAMPELTGQQILKWADAFHKRRKRWPGRDSGIVTDEPSLTWGTIDRYIKRGVVRHKSAKTLSDLLSKARDVWDARGKPELSDQLILKWVQDHRRITGQWPVTSSGRVKTAANESWIALDMALRNGVRGLKGGTTLLKLVTKHRHRIGDPDIAPISEAQIRRWAAAYRRRTGRNPTRKSGKVAGANLTWGAIDAMLARGKRGLKGGRSLANLLGGPRSKKLSRKK